jgi:hypothetical protein
VVARFALPPLVLAVAAGTTHCLCTINSCSLTLAGVACISSWHYSQASSHTDAIQGRRTAVSMAVSQIVSRPISQHTFTVTHTYRPSASNEAGCQRLMSHNYHPARHTASQPVRHTASQPARQTYSQPASQAAIAAFKPVIKSVLQERSC